MNFKIFIFITLVLAIACTSCVDARRKTNRHRESHHSPTTNHQNSVAHHSESGHKTVENEHQHSANNSPKQQINTKDANSQNNQQHISQDQDDFADGFYEGFSAAQRRNRLRRTTIAPTTTTKMPCSNSTLIENNNQQQNSGVNCELPIATTSPPLII